MEEVVCQADRNFADMTSGRSMLLGQRSQGYSRSEETGLQRSNQRSSLRAGLSGNLPLHIFPHDDRYEGD